MNARTGPSIILCGVAILAIVYGSWLSRRMTLISQTLGYEETTGETTLMGRVERGRFRPLGRGSDLTTDIRLTEIQMQEARSPESGELGLGSFEQQILVVRGRDSGGWLYGAQINDKLPPLASWVLRGLRAYR